MVAAFHGPSRDAKCFGRFLMCLPFKVESKNDLAVAFRQFCYEAPKLAACFSLSRIVFRQRLPIVSNVDSEILVVRRARETLRPLVLDAAFLRILLLLEVKCLIVRDSDHTAKQVGLDRRYQDAGGLE